MEAAIKNCKLQIANCETTKSLRDLGHRPRPKFSLFNSPRRRRGFSMLEFQVALILLGIALAGLFPLVAIYSKGVAKLEDRMYNEGVMTLPDPLTLQDRQPIQGYLVPNSNIWARKLGAAAQLTTIAPVPPAPIVTSVDDGDPLNYSESGAWTKKSDAKVFGGQYHHSKKTKATAMWTFCVPPGWYKIVATWPSNTDASWSALNPSTSATYSISDGTVQVGTTVAMDQTQTPGTQGLGGFSDSSNFPWQYLHTAVLLTGPNVTVHLSVPTPNPGNKAVAAAGVQLIPINNVTITSLTRTLEMSGGTGATAQVTVMPGGPPRMTQKPCRRFTLFGPVRERAIANCKLQDANCKMTRSRGVPVRSLPFPIINFQFSAPPTDSPWWRSWSSVS